MTDSRPTENAAPGGTGAAVCSQKLPLTVAEYLRAYQIPMDAVVVSSSNTRRGPREEQCDTMWWTHPANCR